MGDFKNILEIKILLGKNIKIELVRTEESELIEFDFEEKDKLEAVNKFISTFNLTIKVKIDFIDEIMEEAEDEI